MNKKPQVLPWTEHFPWLMDVNGLDVTMLNQIKRTDISYIILKKSEIPEKFIPFVNQQYIHVYTLSDGGWIMKKK